MRLIGNIDFIQSPLNYTGGKYRLLPQLLPLFPERVNLFVDLFCGGCNVGINVDGDKVIYNDLDPNLIYMYNTFKDIEKDVVVGWIYDIIEEYGLSCVSRFGYAHYNCDSAKGLSDYNREAFSRLRRAFNDLALSQSCDPRYYVMLYVLIVYAFNNQIRFNSKGEFNLPVGKRDFNKSMQVKLLGFIDRLKRQENQFLCVDFKDFDINGLDEDDFVYVDPPYLITCATYNEKDGWTENDERDLLRFLDSLDERGVRFALSNVLRSKGKENAILIDWTKRNADRYFVERLNYDYSNSNYHTKDKTSSSEEVLVRNYTT